MNDTLYIDPETHDLAFDEPGFMRTISGDDTAAQNVRLTLQTHKESFPLDLSHGTDYGRFLGLKSPQADAETAKEVIREAAYQETDVVEIDRVDYTPGESRSAAVGFSGQLRTGAPISMEVRI